jgi:hypothetical protein
MQRLQDKDKKSPKKELKETRNLGCTVVHWTSLVAHRTYVLDEEKIELKTCMHRTRSNEHRTINQTRHIERVQDAPKSMWHTRPGLVHRTQSVPTIGNG